MAKLTHKQHKAIAALMSTPSVVAAAKEAKIGHRTLHRWLHEDADFQAALARAEADAIQEASRFMAAGSREAVFVLRKILRDPQTSDRLKARVALGYLSKLPSLRLLANIEERLEQLANEHKP